MRTTATTRTTTATNTLLAILAVTFAVTTIGFVGALGDCAVNISTVEELANFSDSVNSGTNYGGTTVCLSADIAFDTDTSKRFAPIGNSTGNHFEGTFDGQGHIIESLVLNSSSLNIGLFGYSKGTTIRNIVMGSSCSVTCTKASSNSSFNVGGIIGRCEAKNSECVIESVVNVADVSLSGDLKDGYTHIGGITGYLYSTSYQVTVKNCANYGRVSVERSSQNSGAVINIGGISGNCGGSSGSKAYVQNCANYGFIENAVKANKVNLGGIIGYITSHAFAENCLSAGSLLFMNDFSSFGTVVGKINSKDDVKIEHCMWTSDVGDYNATNSSNTIVKDTITDTTLVTPDTATVESLNSYNSDWNKWLLNTNNKSVTFFFSVSGGKSFTTKAQLILLPDLAPKNVAGGWYTDPECMNKFTQTNVTEDTTLYGRVAPNVLIVTFDFGNGTSTSTECPYNETIDYPTELTREGYTFNGWEPEPERMPARNFATKAQWTKVIEPTPLPSSSSSSSRPSSSFTEPIPSSSSSSSSSSSFVSKFVKIVIGEARLSEEDVKEIIKRYTNNDTTAYNIEIVARDDTSTTVIVRFNDTEAAVNFVEAIKSDSNSNWFLFTSISFLSENLNSLSPTTAHPSFLLLLLLTTILASLIL